MSGRLGLALVLTSVFAQRGQNFHRHMDDPNSGLVVTYTTRLGPLARLLTPTAAVGDTVSIEHSGWWGEDWDRQFDAHGDEPLVFTVGQVNTLKGLSMALLGMAVGEEVEAVIPPALGFEHPRTAKYMVFDDARPKPVPDGADILYRIKLVSIHNSTLRELAASEHGARKRRASIAISPAMLNYAGALALLGAVGYFLAGAVRGGKAPAKRPKSGGKKSR